jgi:hypothetical protein
MMFPNATRGYMPFAPSYEQRKKEMQRRARHHSGENKKSKHTDPRKTNSLPALSRNCVDKPQLKFISVPDLEIMKNSQDCRHDSRDKVLASLINLFKKSKNNHKNEKKDSQNGVDIPKRVRADSDKENFVRTRLESIREEDENTGSDSQIIQAPRRCRTAMAALGSSPTSETPAKKHAQTFEDDDNSPC